jgi:hypothetical protein
MNVRQPFFLLCLLFFVAVEGSGAQAVVAQAQPNLWSARSSSGLTLGGTWTAVPEPKTGTVTGTWTLVDAQGRTLAAGGWSASKAPDGWTGNWRAVVWDSKPEYTGAWSASVHLKANAGFADLFEKAVQSVVSGTWRYGRQSGSWSIRAFK